MQRPRISTNLAISADGKISSVSRIKSGWTSKADHQRLLDLRKNADALLVGRGTLDNDRMTLTGPKNPLRCIVSGNGVLDPGHPIFSKAGGDIHLLVTGDNEPSAPPSVIIHRGTLAAFLETLATKYGVKTLHCEGGGSLVKALAEIDGIDDFHLTLAGHTLFGGKDAPTATGIAGGFLPASRHFGITAFEPDPESGECFLSYSRKL